MANWTFFQITIPYVDIFNRQGIDVEQNRFKSGFSNVSDQNSPIFGFFMHTHNSMKEKPWFAKVGKRQAYFKASIPIFKWKY
jgi:hypothetical protein